MSSLFYLWGQSIFQLFLFLKKENGVSGLWAWGKALANSLDLIHRIGFRLKGTNFGGREASPVLPVSHGSAVDNTSCLWILVAIPPSSDAFPGFRGNLCHYEAAWNPWLLTGIQASDGWLPLHQTLTSDYLENACSPGWLPLSQTLPWDLSYRLWAKKKESVYFSTEFPSYNPSQWGSHGGVSVQMSHHVHREEQTGEGVHAIIQLSLLTIGLTPKPGNGAAHVQSGSSYIQ